MSYLQALTRPRWNMFHKIKYIQHLPQIRNYTAKKSLLELKDKVAIITGGMGAIGEAITRELLNKKVRRVFLIDISNDLGMIEALNCEFGGSDAVSLLKADVTNRLEMEDAFKKIITDVDKFDIIVNAAGIYNGRHWEKEMQTNLLSTIGNNILAQRYIGKNGCIINLCGIQGVDPLSASPTLSAEYSGVVTLSRSIGHQKNFQRNSVRIVALCTGITQRGNFNAGATERQLNPDMGEDLAKYFDHCIRQKNEHCGCAVCHVIQHGEPGSVWVVDGGILYSMHYPSWRKYSRLEYSHY